MGRRLLIPVLGLFVVGGVVAWPMAVFAGAGSGLATQDAPQNVQPAPLSAELQAALTRLRTSAENGDATSQMLMGSLYYGAHEGAEAAVWLRRAAEQDQGRAQAILGDIFFKGLGVPQDFAEAAKWSRKVRTKGGDGPTQLCCDAVPAKVAEDAVAGQNGRAGGAGM